MKYIKSINELFFIDRPIVYGMAVDAGQVKKYDLGKDIFIFSRSKNKYFDYYDLEKLKVKWNEYCIKNGIENEIKEIESSDDLDYILKYTEE